MKIPKIQKNICHAMIEADALIDPIIQELSEKWGIPKIKMIHAIGEKLLFQAKREKGVSV
jgi:molybdopterin synthase catalytic subunit